MACFGRKSKADPQFNEVWVTTRHLLNMLLNRGSDMSSLLHVPLQAIATKRRCRDVLWLIIYAAFWGGMLYVAAEAFTKGKCFVGAPHPRTATAQPHTQSRPFACRQPKAPAVWH